MVSQQAKNAASGSELAVIEESNFTALATAPDRLQAILTNNIGESGLSMADLGRIKVPTGGSTNWEIPGMGGESIPAKSFRAIIIGWRKQRSYWPGQYQGGNEPPQCYSDDGVTGHGNPGGKCEECPFAQFGSKPGSDPKRGAQACKLTQLMFLLLEGKLLPIVLSIPPTSLQETRRYGMNLAGEGLLLHEVETEFSLIQEKGSSGPYSRVVLRASRPLNPAERQRAEAYVQSLEPAIKKVRAESSDYNAA